MVQKLSKEFLFSIRNHIPIAQVIADMLQLPWKRSDGYFRFVCPKCQEFRTAVNEKTNLARCFLCEINFNCIDLVMIVKKVKFLKAIDILSPLLVKYSQSKTAR